MLPYRLGLPMWSHKPWQGSFFSQAASQPDFLKEYASVFNTVEGNTTFYAIPSEASINAWNESAPKGFCFSFKLPKLITHELKLQRCQLSVKRFFERVEPLADRMGPIMIQLPPSFDFASLPILESFLKTLPANYHYAVEVRHLDFFDKSDREFTLNDMLARFHIDRVSFDSRGLFACEESDEFTLDAKAKKPRLPVHAIALGKTPVVRFVGHSSLPENDSFFSPWVEKLSEWLQQGKEPYVFIHLADNTHAPHLALQLHQQLQQAIPSLPDLPAWPVEQESGRGQIGLF